MGVYGPDTQVNCLLKGLNVWGTYRKHIDIFQMIFNLDERHSFKATVLESWQKCINWVSVGTFETLSRPLWVNLQP